MEIPDIVLQRKIDTVFHPEYTQHVRFRSGSRAAQKLIRVEERWKEVRHLGRGGAGDVWLQRNIQGERKGQYRAVKCLRKTGAHNLYAELEVVALLSHDRYGPCFVESHGWYENADCIFMTMEYLPHGDLYSHVKIPLAESETCQIAHQLLQGLEFMGKHNITHRDLKPLNILVKNTGPDWWVKIADFGISKRLVGGQAVLQTATGTADFCAPEVRFGKRLPDGKSVHPYTSAVDIWSFGAVVFWLLVHQIPFDTRQLLDYQNGRAGFPTALLLEEGLSSPGCDFVVQALSAQPENRPSVARLQNHEWMKAHPGIGTPVHERASETRFTPHGLPLPTDQVSVSYGMTQHSSESFGLTAQLEQVHADDYVPAIGMFERLSVNPDYSTSNNSLSKTTAASSYSQDREEIVIRSRSRSPPTRRAALSDPLDREEIAIQRRFDSHPTQTIPLQNSWDREEIKTSNRSRSPPTRTAASLARWGREETVIRHGSNSPPSNSTAFLDPLDREEIIIRHRSNSPPSNSTAFLDPLDREEIIIRHRSNSPLARPAASSNPWNGEEMEVGQRSHTSPTRSNAFSDRWAREEIVIRQEPFSKSESFVSQASERNEIVLSVPKRSGRSSGYIPGRSELPPPPATHWRPYGHDFTGQEWTADPRTYVPSTTMPNTYSQCHLTGGELLHWQDLYCLGIWQYGENEYDVAEQSFMLAVTGSREDLGDASKESAYALQALGIVQLAKRHYVEAEQSLVLAYSALQRELGDDHEIIAQSFDARGVAQFQQKRYGDAERSFDRAYDTYRRMFVSERPETADSLHCRGAAQVELMKLPQAAESFLLAYSIRRTCFGQQDARTAVSMCHRGRIQRLQRNYNEAEKSLSTAQWIFTQALGYEHRTTAWCLGCRGRVQLDQGNSPMAEQAFREACSINRTLHAGSHPELTLSLFWLGNAQMVQSKLPEAEHSFHEASLMGRNSAGVQDEVTAAIWDRLGDTQWLLKKFDKAEWSIQQAYHIRLQLREPNSAGLSRSAYVLGRIQYELKKYPEAQESFEHSHNMRVHSLGYMHPMTVDTENWVQKAQKHAAGRRSRGGWWRLHDKLSKG